MQDLQRKDYMMRLFLTLDANVTVDTTELSGHLFWQSNAQLQVHANTYVNPYTVDKQTAVLVTHAQPMPACHKILYTSENR